MANAVLTPLLISPSDLKRTRRELELLDDVLHQAALRQGGKAVKLPTTSRILDELARDSDLNLLKKTDRDRLVKFLQLLMQKAPVVHISFASEPSGAFLSKLIVWLRANIHPQIFMSVGLQPSIAAGCIVRTANRQFDFSLRQSLQNQTAALSASLRADDAKPVAEPSPAKEETAAPA